MGDRCHVAHDKSELRGPGDPLPEYTPYVSDQKLVHMNFIGISSISNDPIVAERLIESGILS